MPSLLSGLVAALAVLTPADAFRDLDVDGALAAAEREHAPLLLVFEREDDPACRALAPVWKEPELAGWIAERFVAVRVDVRVDVHDPHRWEVHEVPTVVVAGPDGVELERVVGPRGAAELRAAVEDALAGRGPVALARGVVATSQGDPHARIALGDLLRDQGRAHAALVEYLQAYDLGVGDAAFARERRGLLLERIVGLQHREHHAVAALEHRRAQLEARLLGGSGTPEEAADFAALGRFADRRERTLFVYDMLRDPARPNHALRSVLFESVADELLEKRRYGAYLEGAGDVASELERRAAAYRERQRELGDAADTDPELGVERQRILVAAAGHYHALLGAGLDDMARERSDWLLAFDPTPRAFALLLQHAGSAGNSREVERLGEIGLASFGGPERDVIEHALDQARRDL